MNGDNGNQQITDRASYMYDQEQGFLAVEKGRGREGEGAWRGCFDYESCDKCSSVVIDMCILYNYM